MWRRPAWRRLFFDLVVAGFVPILTHPERLDWIKSQYPLVQRLVREGVWMQITAGSLAGAFGGNARYWGERMLEEGCVHLIATDAHDVTRRPPNLGLGRECAARRVGEAEAQHMVLTRPAGVLRNVAPQSLPDARKGRRLIRHCRIVRGALTGLQAMWPKRLFAQLLMALFGVLLASCATSLNSDASRSLNPSVTDRSQWIEFRGSTDGPAVQGGAERRHRYPSRYRKRRL